MKPVRVTMEELGAMFCTGGRNIGEKASKQQAEHQRQAKQAKREQQQKSKGRRK